MYLSKAVSALCFIVAFMIGVAPSYLSAGGGSECRDASPTVRVFKPTPVQAEDMVGVWRGNWDKDQAKCTITIDRIDGERFYGTLRKRGAEVTFVGTLDPNSRTVAINETKVIRHGEHGRWSLGTNTGSFSFDGRTLTGAGSDEYGVYFWNVTKD